MNTIKDTRGKSVIKSLAEVYQQLYLCPGDEGREKYPDIVRMGMDAEQKDLSHFMMSEKDRLDLVETPEGKVTMVTLSERRDFVTFLRIMANRCDPVSIPDTQGASMISGVINWTKINAHKEQFFKERISKGDVDPDWETEFRSFTSDKRNYLDVVIVLSVGPYSGIPGTAFGYTDDEWIGISNTIRLYHECTHFVCGKRYPAKKDAVWDELVADAVGIYAALGKFDPDMEGRFLGIGDERYSGGRLENYITDLSGEERQTALDEMAARISGILKSFENKIAEKTFSGPFDIIDPLQEMQDAWNER